MRSAFFVATATPAKKQDNPRQSGRSVRLSRPKINNDKSAFGAKKIAISCCTLSLSHTLATATAFRNLFLFFFLPNAKLKKKKSFPFWAEHDKAVTTREQCDLTCDSIGSGACWPEIGQFELIDYLSLSTPHSCTHAYIPGYALQDGSR